MSVQLTESPVETQSTDEESHAYCWCQIAQIQSSNWATAICGYTRYPRRGEFTEALTCASCAVMEDAPCPVCGFGGKP